MNQPKVSAIQKIRQEKGLSRKDLAIRSGVNFRSIQDYEQGHKDISSAKAETVYRLSQVLGCDMEVLLQDHVVTVSDHMQEHFDTDMTSRLSAYRKKLMDFASRMETVKFYSQEYKVSGCLKYEDEAWYLEFEWDDEIICQPFDAVITEQTVPWIEDVCRMKMEQYIQERIFLETYDK